MTNISSKTGVPRQLVCFRSSVAIRHCQVLDCQSAFSSQSHCEASRSDSQQRTSSRLPIHSALQSDLSILWTQTLEQRLSDRLLGSDVFRRSLVKACKPLCLFPINPQRLSAMRSKYLRLC